MGTRCVIGTMVENNQVNYIYCHFDGYPEGVGAKLNTEHWKTQRHINWMMDAGDLIALYPTFQESKFYLKDKDARRNINDPEDYKARLITQEQWDKDLFAFCNIEWAYLFNPHTKEWTCKQVQ